MAQIFTVSVTRANKVHQDKPTSYVVGVAGTLTRAMEIQSKSPGSKINITNY
jgi:hypothetical protein